MMQTVYGILGLLDVDERLLDAYGGVGEGKRSAVSFKGGGGCEEGGWECGGV